jgi:alkanesulfonate monooxygenase SsuD/methylene tetrahydromethanopterin reductase-like flavin-dependent oxidoreductase (luciferase family)
MHWMPWPYLPDSFRETYDSALLSTPNRLYDPVKGSELFNEWLDLLEYCEELGFDGVCYNEHHQMPHAHVPAANIITAALMRRTKTLKFAPIGHVVPTYHPVQLAEEIAMLDVISRGRVIVGVAKGIGSEYLARNINPADAREMFDEQMDIMTRAWTEQEPFAYDGKFYQLPCVSIWPRPLQQPHPPIWVPSIGTPGTSKWAAEHRYPIIKGFSSDDSMAQVFEGYRAAARGFGYEAPPEQIGVSKHVYLADTDREAFERGAPHFEYTLHSLMKAPTEVWFPAGMVPPAAYGRAATMVKEWDEMPIADMNARGDVLIGSTETVIEHLTASHQRFNYGILIVTLALGKMNYSEAKRNMEVFARDVMPALRKLG